MFRYFVYLCLVLLPFLGLVRLITDFRFSEVAPFLVISILMWFFGLFIWGRQLFDESGFGDGKDTTLPILGNLNMMLVVVGIGLMFLSVLLGLD